MAAEFFDVVVLLVVFFTELFAGTFARHRFLHAALFARLQVIGVTLHVLDDVFGLNLALESTEGILQRLTFLYANFCQPGTPNER